LIIASKKFVKSLPIPIACLRKDFSSFSGASSFTLFNLQGARVPLHSASVSVAGTLLYHARFNLSRGFLISFSSSRKADFLETLASQGVAPHRRSINIPNACPIVNTFFAFSCVFFYTPLTQQDMPCFSAV
ncbi:hypothetical protein NE547_08115, partial [Flavonifractor sp. DFI.6.63]